MAKAAKFLGGAVVAVIALFALGYLWLQTASGKNWIEAEAAHALANPGESVAIAGLEGSVPFDFRIASVAISDQRGPVLRVEDLNVAVSAMDLLRGHLVFRRIAARDVEMTRARQSQGPTDWAKLFDPPLPVAVEHFAIGRLVLGQELAGAPMTLQAEASAVIGGGRAEAELAAHRTDGTPGELSLHGAFDGTRLSLAARVSEPTGTVLAALLGRADKLPLTLTLTGDGDLAHWRGDFALAAGGDAHAKGTLTIAGDAPHRVALTADAEVASLAPPAYRALLLPGVRIDGALSLGDDGVALDHLAVSSGAAQLSGTGTLTRKTGALAGTAHLALADLAPFAPIAKTTLAGSGTLAVALGGTLEKPTLDATLDLAHAAGGGISAEAAHANLSLRPAGDPRTSITAITAAGTVTGAATSDGALPDRLGDAIAWRIAAAFDPSAMTLAAERVSVEDGGATLDGAARADRAGATGTLRLVLPNVATFDGGALSGALDVSADFRASADGAGTAVVSGAIAAPRTTSAALDRALGAKVGFSATLSRAADGTISAHEVALDAASAHVAGAGERHEDGTLQATITAAAPRLAALDPRLTGALTASATLAGAPQDLAGRVTLAAPALAANGFDLANLSAQVTLTRAWPLDAHLTARAEARGIAVTLAADGAASGNAFRLTRFTAAAGGARIDGAASYVAGRIDGKLNGTAPNLAAFSALAGQPLAGRATFAATAAGERYGVTLDANGLVAGGGTVGRLHVAADIASPFARPTGHGEISVADATEAGAQIATAKITATSSAPGRFALDAAVTGTAPKPFTLAAAASLALERGNGTLALARFGGAVGGMNFALAHPLAASWQGGDARFSNLDLKLGSGELTGDGALAAGTQKLHLVARGLPVGALADLANYEAEGRLGFEVTLAGTRRAPEAHVVIDGEELRLGETNGPDLPALGLVARADWQDGSVRTMGRLAGPNGAAIGWQGEAPLRLAPDRLAPQLPKSGAIAFHLEGQGELASLSDLLPLGQDRIAGHFATELRVDGTVAAPRASGRFTVTDGRYESLYTGATLAGISFSLVGDRDRLVLENFAANDGAKGSLHMSGAIDLAAPGGPAFDAHAQVSHFQALHRDEASATASGTLSLTGGLAAPKLEAALTIDNAEIAVPKELPQSSRPVEATLIDSATGARLASAATAPSKGLVPVTLDVTVASPGKVFVRGRGLDSEWRGKVALAGSTQAPRITGTLAVVHGTFDFIGKTFTLSKGDITFLGGASIDPTVAIEARAQGATLTAIVGISGTATRPTIKLSSEPAFPRDEILSQLLFGTSMSQISAAQGLELAAAAASLSGNQSLDVLGGIRRGLGLDRLTLGSAPGSVVPGLGVPSLTGPPGETGGGAQTALGTTPTAPGTGGVAPGEAGSTALNAGKYVANGVYVGVSQGIGASSSTVTVEVDVSRHITLDTEAGEASGSGVGINWKLDY